MPDGVLLDTSFLISFADPARANHAAAKEYFSYFLEDKIPMYLSSIVASEFHLGQSVKDLPLSVMIELPFNIPDAIRSAELDFRPHKGTSDTPRASLKDDFKILGQVKSHQIAFLITEDESSLYKYCEGFRKKGLLSTRAIKLSGGFKKSHFDPAGQEHFELG